MNVSDDVRALNPELGDAPPKSSKYGNREKVVDGVVFGSEAEAQRGQELLQLQQAGTITDLEFQVSYTLLEGFRDRQGTWHRPITYIVDAQYREGGRLIVEDTKGHKTDKFRIKEKLFRHRYPDIELRLIGVRGGGRRRKGKAA